MNAAMLVLTLIRTSLTRYGASVYVKPTIGLETTSGSPKVRYDLRSASCPPQSARCLASASVRTGASRRKRGVDEFTFWTHWRNRYERDDGLRVDHLLLSPELVHRLKRVGVDRSVRGKQNASDHSPAWAFLK